MEVATAKEARALTNKTKAITPGTLREVLSSYATKEYADTHGGGGGGSGLVDDVKVNGVSVVRNKIANVSVPTSLSQLTNDDHYVQTVNGYIPAEYLPSYVDDVLEYQLFADLPNPGETGKIYVVLATNLTYRWTGSTYVEISQSLALGETQDTAYRGDRGKTAYDHSQIVNGNPHGLTLSTFGIAVTAAEINYLSGLSENIVTALNKKLNLTGGVLTGYLTLHSNPAQDMHAATKIYVDNAIYSVAVTVNQNVTHYNEIIDKMNLQETLLGVTADTLIKVNNKVDTYSYVQYQSSEYTVGDTIVPIEAIDMVYKEDINYYIESSGTYTLLVEGTDYTINDEIHYNSEGHTIILCDNVYELNTTYTYDETSHIKYKSNANYYKEDFSMVVSGDSTYLQNKKYFRYNGTNYIEMIPFVDYTIGSSITGTVYEMSYLGTYTLLVQGTDYMVGETIEGKVYQYVQHQDYTLTEDTTWQANKTYYHRKLTGGIDTILSSHKDTITNIIQTEGEISSTVSTTETFINNNIKNTGGLIDQVTDNRGKINNILSSVGTIKTETGANASAISGVLGTLAEFSSALTDITNETKINQTDSYIKSEVQTIINGEGYFLTRDLVFVKDRTYWIKDSNNIWTEYTNYNVGDIIPENLIYEYGKTKVVVSESGKFDDDGLLIAKEEVYDYEYKQTKHRNYLAGIRYYTHDTVNDTYDQLRSFHKIPLDPQETTFDATKTYYIVRGMAYVEYPQTEYMLTEDTEYKKYGYKYAPESTFKELKYYFTESNGTYTPVDMSITTISTTDTTFQASSNYYRAIPSTESDPFEIPIYKLIYDSTTQKYTDYDGTIYNVGDPIPNDPDHPSSNDIATLTETITLNGENYIPGDSIPNGVTLYELYIKQYADKDTHILKILKEYNLTEDTTYSDIKTYYIKTNDVYSIYLDYTPGDPIPSNTIYECTGDYSYGDPIIVGTVSEFIYNWNDGDPIPQELSLFKNDGDYFIGESIPETFFLTPDTVYNGDKYYYTRTGSGTTEDPYVYKEKTDFQPDAPIPSNTIYERSTTIYNESKEKTKFISNTIGRYNEKGMKIRRVSDQFDEDQNEEILYAGVDESNPDKSVVRTINLEAKEYLYAANKHMRIEQFTVNNNPGWGMFYL